MDDMKKISDTAIEREQAGDIEGALECYDELIILNPEISLWHVCKAKVYIHLKEYEKALGCLDRMVELEPDNFTAWGFYERAYALYHLGKGAEAMANLSRALDIDPHYASAHFCKGVILYEYYKTKRDPAILEDALQCYDEAARADETDCDALFNKGLALADAHRTDEAIACYDTAIGRNPEYYKAIYSKGDIFLDSGKYEMALECYTRALQLAPDRPNIMYNASKALWLSERAKDAYALLKKAYKLDSDLPDCKNILEMLQERTEFEKKLHDSHHKKSS